MQEDDLLKNLIAIYGPRNWSIIASGIKGRSGKSCRLRYATLCGPLCRLLFAPGGALQQEITAGTWRRWCNQLDPDVKKEPFSDWEDAVIVQVQRPAADGPCIVPREHGRKTLNPNWNLPLPMTSQPLSGSWLVIGPCLNICLVCRLTRCTATNGPVRTPQTRPAFGAQTLYMHLRQSPACVESL